MVTLKSIVSNVIFFPKFSTEQLMEMVNKYLYESTDHNHIPSSYSSYFSEHHQLQPPQNHSPFEAGDPLEDIFDITLNNPKIPEDPISTTITNSQKTEEQK